MILEGLKTLFNANEQYRIATFTRGSELLQHMQTQQVDVVLLDIVLNDGSGLEFCKQVKQVSPKTVTIGMSNQAERSILFQFLQNGGNGYILKNADADEIVSCVEKAINGDLALSKEAQEIILNQPENTVEIPRLTKRENQILQAIASGQTSAEIADVLYVSVITVETHRRNLLQKFKAKNMVELVKMAMEHKLIA